VLDSSCDSRKIPTSNYSFVGIFVENIPQRKIVCSFEVNAAALSPNSTVFSASKYKELNRVIDGQEVTYGMPFPPDPARTKTRKLSINVRKCFWK
jgi:hypothetical protein